MIYESAIKLQTKATKCIVEYLTCLQDYNLEFIVKLMSHLPYAVSRNKEPGICSCLIYHIY